MERVIQGTEMRGVGLFMYILKLSQIMTGIIWMIVTVIPRQKSGRTVWEVQVDGRE